MRACQPKTHRSLFTEALPTVLVPPVLFTGLLIGLWTYKCLMTVVFQDKVIYLPYMPPFARYEKIDDYRQACRPVEWRVQHIRSIDGTKLAVCIGEIPELHLDSTISTCDESHKQHVVICYFQGNGSSTPPRLPLLSNVLKYLHVKAATSGQNVRFTMLTLSYRGFWKSSGRASQAGIELDAQSFLEFAASMNLNSPDTQLVLWGQSIGAGVAATAAAISLRSTNHMHTVPSIKAVILETPFTNIKQMLFALYPQKWLPYKYLWPFLWNHWDSEYALRKIASSSPPEQRPKVLIVAATRDEVVPAEEADKLETLCKGLGLDIARQDVIGALHTDATIRKEGQEIVGDFIRHATAK